MTESSAMLAIDREIPLRARTGKDGHPRKRRHEHEHDIVLLRISLCPICTSDMSISLKVVRGITILSRGKGSSNSDFGGGGVSFRSSNGRGVLTLDFSTTWRRLSSHLREQCAATVSSQETKAYLQRHMPSSQ